MRDYSQLEASAGQAVDLLKAMGNKHRLMILCALQEGELSVTELNALFPMPQSSLSQHLAWLRKQGYVKTRRQAQTIYYSLDSSEVIAVISVLHRLYCQESE